MKKNGKDISEWDVKFEEFEKVDGMPAKGSELYFWKERQLSNGKISLEARIIDKEGLGGNEWSEMRTMLKNAST